MSDLQVIAEGSVLRVTINRPAKRNALSRCLLKGLGEVFAASSSDQHLKAAVLRGSGELCFAAGCPSMNFRRSARLRVWKRAAFAGDWPSARTAGAIGQSRSSSSQNQRESGHRET
jgi:enoyl-CoA hydratase/carnithine racemase